MSVTTSVPAIYIKECRSAGQLETFVNSQALVEEISGIAKDLIAVDIATTTTNLALASTSLQLSYAAIKTLPGQGELLRSISKIILGYQDLLHNTSQNSAKFVTHSIEGLYDSKNTYISIDNGDFDTAEYFLGKSIEKANDMYNMSGKLVQQTSKIIDSVTQTNEKVTDTESECLDLKDKLKQKIDAELAEQKAQEITLEAINTQFSWIKIELEKIQALIAATQTKQDIALAGSFALKFAGSTIPVAAASVVAISCPAAAPWAMSAGLGVAGFVANGANFAKFFPSIMGQNNQGDKEKKIDLDKTLIDLNDQNQKSATEYALAKRRFEAKSKDLAKEKERPDRDNKRIEQLEREAENALRLMTENESSKDRALQELETYKKELLEHEKNLEGKEKELQDTYFKFLENRKNANIKLVQSVQQMQSLQTKDKPLEQAIDSLGLAIKMLFYVNTTFKRIRMYWKGMSDATERLKNQSQELKRFFKKQNSKLIQSQIVNSGYLWAAIGKVSINFKKDITKVVDYNDARVSDMPTVAEAQKRLDVNAPILIQQIEAENRDIDKLIVAVKPAE